MLRYRVVVFWKGIADVGKPCSYVMAYFLRSIESANGFTAWVEEMP